MPHGKALVMPHAHGSLSPAPTCSALTATAASYVVGPLLDTWHMVFDDSDTIEGQLPTG
jgi:hypothetical protein